MPERTSLERELRLLGEATAWPEPPDLAASVAERLRGEAEAGGGPAVLQTRVPRGLRLRVNLRAVALAALALLVLAGTVMAASPAIRDSVLDLIGLSGATVDRRERLPDRLRQDGRPFLGDRVSLPEARRAVRFQVLAPRALGPPDRVYLRRDIAGGELTLVFRARPGLPAADPTGIGALVSEFRADLAPELIRKIAPGATEVRQLRIGRSRALWLEGAPHAVLLRDAAGRILKSEPRLAGNVLLVERGRLLVRIEADVSLRQALQIARSLR